MKIIKSVVFMSLTLLLLASCQTDTKTEVSIAEVTRSIFYAPQYVALEKGFFDDEGLDVDLQTTWGGDKTMTTLLSDGVDVALVGSETSIYVYGQNPKDYAVNFAQLTQTDGTFLVSKEARPDFSWDDLNESIFLGQRKGGMPQMVGEYVLKQHEIAPHDDLELRQNVDFGNIPGAFASGDAEYVQLFEPTASVFEEEGKGNVIASFGEQSGKLPYTVYMAKKNLLDDDPETYEAFTRAIYTAQKWVEDSSPKEVAEVIQPYFEDTELDMIASSVERYKDQESFATDPTLEEDEWNKLKEIMDEAGELPEEEIPYDVLVNTEIAKEIINE